MLSSPLALEVDRHSKFGMHCRINITIHACNTEDILHLDGSQEDVNFMFYVMKRGDQMGADHLISNSVGLESMGSLLSCNARSVLLLFFWLCLVFGIVSMTSAFSPQWNDKASDFFSSSGVKLKEAGQSAGTFVGGVAKDAKVNVADATGRVGSLVKSRWSLIQEAARRPSLRDEMQERFISAAASTGTLLRKSISETKDKVSIGKIKVEEVAKKTAQRSKSILTNIERWQKGVASTDVFGVPIEMTVQRQQSSRPIPHILIKCADYLILSGLNSEYLFKSEGDINAIQQLVSLYNQDWKASLPDGVNPADVAFLVKCYLASLPEPLTTFELYHEIGGARSSIHAMRNILKKLPNVNYMTLEFVTALLLRVSQKSPLNKMDARSLATEIAPVIIWQKEKRPEFFRQFWHQASKGPSKKAMDPAPTYSAWDILSEEGDDIDASSLIPLDDGLPTDFGVIEVVQCLIEHHNAIFTDANETVWR
ncbi:hypothetical protein HHK36_028030 [Tetracentron sinense]|uniref:Rho-GAP domain-containing protein n=1 Tax=Tetracentron sinense TaxID=13715 RepID=A0A834YE68_TETSI|nr:hypothetical protein HHK36_028030 [Tetracentron sinense]